MTTIGSHPALGASLIPPAKARDYLKGMVNHYLQRAINEIHVKYDDWRMETVWGDMTPTQMGRIIRYNMEKNVVVVNLTKKSLHSIAGTNFQLPGTGVNGIPAKYAPPNISNEHQAAIVAFMTKELLQFKDEKPGKFVVPVEIVT